jgi:hypothetical protein
MLRLSRKLEGRRKRLDLSWRSTWMVSRRCRRTCGALARVWQQQLETSRTNLALLISEAPRERMQVVGVRTAADADEVGDEQAWALWRRCGLPVASADVHRMMLGWVTRM